MQRGMAMVDNRFFDESREQSQVKAEIVEKYFWSWAHVIISNQKKNDKYRDEKIAYIDLFAGPGRYKDGAESTPLRILKRAIDDDSIRNKLIAIFNDKDENNTRSLEEEISKIQNLHLLRFPPKIYNTEIGTNIVKNFESTRFAPTLFFIDPWGYKGLSARLINSVIKDWGCDCIFFFNYNRISMGLSNPYVEEHMNALFGEERTVIIKKQLENYTIPCDREFFILNELASVFTEHGKRFILPFRFKNEKGTRTTHHLIFISKNVKGYEIMKEIMAGYSSTKDQGVPSFEYNPADERFPFLFGFNQPLDTLGDMLLNDFKGKKLQMVEIYNQHHIGKLYIKRNYKMALNDLEKQGKIMAQPAESKRPTKNGIKTFGDKVIVAFPG
jgi:three-Cys-motif partner protein